MGDERSHQTPTPLAPPTAAPGRLCAEPAAGLLPEGDSPAPHRPATWGQARTGHRELVCWLSEAVGGTCLLKTVHFHRSSKAPGPGHTCRAWKDWPKFNILKQLLEIIAENQFAGNGSLWAGLGSFSSGKMSV